VIAVGFAKVTGTGSRPLNGQRRMRDAPFSGRIGYHHRAASRRPTLKSGLAAENRTQMLLIGESNAKEQY
jgi:hypothetical protein